MKVAIETVPDLLTADIDAQDVFEQVAAHCDRLREVARGLRDGSMHPAHAANSIMKHANAISVERAKEEEDK